MDARILLEYFGVHPGTKRNRDLVIEDGFYVNIHTGQVLGRHLELDSHNGCSSPLYYYNRSWRFTALFNTYSIAREDQYETLRFFEGLEKVWERVKKKYNRVYFLSQRLLLQEITKRLDIPSTQPRKRPISDLRRYKAQIKILNELWAELPDKFICNKCLNYTSETSNSSVSIPPTQNYR